MSEVPPDQAYQAMGFSRWDGVSPRVDYARWKALQTSQKLEDVRARYLLRRDQAGAGIVVEEGYVVGFVPALTLGLEEVEKLLSALTEGMARGLTTTDELRQYRRSLKA